MKYMGSKARFVKDILPIILKDREANQCYVEPFVGGANVITHATGKRIGADNNKYLIALFKGLQDGLKGIEDIPKAIYDEARRQYNNTGGSLSDFEVGWIGFMGSANGRFFEGGYSGVSDTKIGTKRDYIAESIRNIQKQDFSGIEFMCSDYRELAIPENSIVYCDPPYAGTKKYQDSFDHDAFWEWCDKMSKEHKVFVSEYVAPDGWRCVWEKQSGSSLSANGLYGGRKQSIERLFTK